MQTTSKPRVLVLHPEDKSTDFLSRIYQDKDWTVIRDRSGNSLRRRLIHEHDIIIMMGHGTEKGLANSNFDPIIDSKFVQQLREKTCIGIWCNADQFFLKYKLTGLYTGMIISEFTEAQYESVTATYYEIEESNRQFAKTIAEHLDLSNLSKSAHDIKMNYDIVDEVTAFNNERIYFRDSTYDDIFERTTYSR